MSYTVDEIQSEIAAYEDENPVTSSIDSTVYALRLKFMNMALREWQEARDWQVLYKEYNMLISAATGNASIALPSDFRKPASYVQIAISTGNLFKITKPQASFQYLDSEKRVEFLGNPYSNYTMRIYGATLPSGVSVKIPYYASANSLTTSSDLTEVPNPQYLVKRTLAYLLEGREDARFVQMKLEADRILANMMEHEDVFSVGDDEDHVKTIEQTLYNVRWGE